MCPVLPWGAGEGAPWVPDTLKGSGVLPPSLSREGWEPLFPGAGGHACLWITALSLQGSEQSCPSLLVGRGKHLIGLEVLRSQMS